MLKKFHWRRKWGARGSPQLLNFRGNFFTPCCIKDMVLTIPYSQNYLPVHIIIYYLRKFYITSQYLWNFHSLG